MIDMLDNAIPDFNPNKIVNQPGGCDHQHAPVQQNVQFTEDWPTSFPKPVIGIEKNEILTTGGTNVINSALTAVKLIRKKGHRLFFINDERGRDPSQVESEWGALMEIFGQAGIQNIDGMYFSPGMDKQDPFVKPNTGMYKRATDEHGIKWNRGWIVGNTIADMKAADKLGAKPILIKTPKGLVTMDKLKTHANKQLNKKVKVFDSLMEFASSLN